MRKQEVWISYCCVTNYSTISKLKIANICCLAVSMVRNLEAAWLGGSSLRSLMNLQSRCWRRLQTSEGCRPLKADLGWEGLLPSSLIWLLARGLSSSICGPLQRAIQHGSWLPPEQEIQETATRKSQYLLWPRLGNCMLSVPFSFCSLGVSHEDQPTLKGKGNYALPFEGSVR